MGAPLHPISANHLQVQQIGLGALRLRLHALHKFHGLRPLHLRLALTPNVRQIKQPLVLTPAFILEIRSQEIDARGPGIRPPDLGARPHRLWPFRWPTEDPTTLDSAPSERPVAEIGTYLDVLF